MTNVMASAPAPVRRSPLDLFAAPVAAAAAPMIALLALLIRLRLGRPVLFRHERAGLHGRPFTLYKLRTMTDDRDDHGRLLPDAQRLSAFGRWLRSTSLDELPELWNVLRGEMALVGPRPLPTSYLERYTPEEARRHDVRPGITGWAQVNGRNSTTWEERLSYDIWYVDNRSLRLDMRILWATVWMVLRRQGVAAIDHATMPELRPPGPGQT